MTYLAKEIDRFFREQLEPHVPMLRAWLSKRFNSADDAEDIIQDSLIKVIEKRKLKTIEYPKAFLFAIARNAALMRIRRMKVRDTVSLAELCEWDIPIDEEADVNREISRNEELEMLTQALRSLPKRCRQVMTLRKIYGITQKQIAKELGISENTVETQIGIGSRKINEYFDRFEIR